VSDAGRAEPPSPGESHRPSYLDVRHGTGGIERPAGVQADPGRARLFRWLRILLPVTAVGVLVISLFWSQIIPRDSRIGVETQPQDEAAGRPGEAVVNATYSGVDRQGRPFSVTAVNVSSPEGQGNVLQLSRPSGEITLRDGSQATLAASDGVYDRAGDTLALRGDVTLRHGDLTARSPSAMVDLKTSSASGDDPVEGSGSFGTVAGQGFRVGEDGNTVLVTGPARLLIVPGAKPMLK